MLVDEASKSLGSPVAESPEEKADDRIVTPAVEAVHGFHDSIVLGGIMELDAYDVRVARKALEPLMSASRGGKPLQKGDRFGEGLVIFVDVNGSKPLPPLLDLCDRLETCLQPDKMVVKSNLLKRLMMKSELWINREARLTNVVH